MKKIVMLFSCMLLLTGCSTNLKYNFDEYIESNVNTSFNLNEYKKVANDYYGNDFGDQSDDVLKQNIESSKNKVNAFINNNSTFYNTVSYSSNSNLYNASYKYTYTYLNFKDNYFLNQCFDNFIMSQDDAAYYFKISGDSKCNGANLIITANNRMINNNSTNVKNNEYTWNIKEKDNNIYFAISRVAMNDSSINVLYVVYFIIGLAIAFIAYIFKNKKK